MLVNSNEKIGISGNSGSGKKTLIKLLLGFFNINKGTILYDKIRLDNYDINQLRMAISACFEEMKIFDGSFLENITMGKELHQNQVVEVLQITGLYEVLMKYPEGLFNQNWSPWNTIARVSHTEAHSGQMPVETGTSLYN
ncbi:MAG: ATP-binding cassette domain-containing protein [Saprospiraceae bacterium]|nr:ATP-binding cassette domain-containing protein [Saprospiraceae bacterium]